MTIFIFQASYIMPQTAFCIIRTNQGLLVCTYHLLLHLVSLLRTFTFGARYESEIKTGLDKDSFRQYAIMVRGDFIQPWYVMFQTKKRHCVTEVQCKIPKSVERNKWNVTPLIRRASNFYFFAVLYCSCLGFNALHALPTKEGGNKGINSKKGAKKCC